MIKFLKTIGLLAILAVTLSACSNSDEPSPGGGSRDRLILIYAVADNDLSGALISDMGEIKKVGPKLDLKNNKLLLYQVNPSEESVLQELRNVNGTYEFVTVRKYPYLPLSTSEARISEIMQTVTEDYDYEKKGLILWSHATGWLPWFGNFPEEEKRKSFGRDKYEGSYYECNINILADCIPEGAFDFIWFDCCYMANIETAYQLREKCETIVGYVTEIDGRGMPYHLTMPYLLRKNPDLQNAAADLFDYYDFEDTPVTVSLIKTEELQAVAEIAGQIFNTGSVPSGLNSIQNYSRISGQPFYDLGNLLENYSGMADDLKNDLKEALDRAVPWRLISAYGFNGVRFSQTKYCGLSVHNYTDSQTANANFYRGLDWFKATRGQ